MEVPFDVMDMCLCSLLFIFLLIAEQSPWMHIPSRTDVFFVLLSTLKFSHNEFETWEINSVGFLWLVSWSVKNILHFLSRVIWIQHSFRGRGLNRLALSGKILFWICGMEYYCCFKHHCLKQAIANYHKLEASSSFVKIALLYKLYSRKTFRYYVSFAMQFASWLSALAVFVYCPIIKKDAKTVMSGNVWKVRKSVP